MPVEHDQRESREEQVVQQEGGLARHRRIDATGRTQLVAAPGDEADTRRTRTVPRKAEQPRPDARLRERVHRVDHARTGEERAEDGEAERREHERQVPDAQHSRAVPGP